MILVSLIFIQLCFVVLSVSENIECKADGTCLIDDSIKSKANVKVRKVSSYSYAANKPNEDRHTHGEIEKWYYNAVFDGHGGWEVAESVSKLLASNVIKKLNSIPTSSLSDQEILDEEITSAFQETEDYIVDNEIRPVYRTGKFAISHVGSCALLTLIHNNELIVCNAGDCQAVLASSSTSNDANIVAKALSNEHNIRVRSEQEKLQLEHPDERDLYKCKGRRACYVKGRLQLTRSFGDVYLKTKEFNDKVNPWKLPEPFNPPYITHLPEIHHYPLQSNDRFIILGSDGLWDYLTHQEAVDIVLQFLNNPDYIAKYKSLNLEQREAKVAEILARKALEGAAEQSQLSVRQLYRLKAGKERRSYHDDTTVLVVFLESE